MQERKKAVKPALSIKHMLIKFGKQERKKKKKDNNKKDRQTGKGESKKEGGKKRNKEINQEMKDCLVYTNKVGDANNTSQI